MPSHHTLLLIYPPFYRLFSDQFSYHKFPVSLGYLADSVLRGTNWDVHVYNADFNRRALGGNSDATFTFRSGTGFDNYLRRLNDLSSPIWEEVRTTLRTYKPELVGISSMTPTHASACLVAQLTKELDKNITVVIGGPHASITGAAALDSPHVDIAVRGEGELTLVELLNALEHGTRLDHVKGIIFRNCNSLVETPPQNYLPDLGSLGFPHEVAGSVLKDFEYYPRESFSNVFANRGCPFDCAFCGSRYIWSRQVRFRPIPHLMKEIQGLRAKGINTLYFCDDTFGVNKKWLSDFCAALINARLGVRWSCEIHARLIDDCVVSLMKKAGCYQIELGIESGNNDILRRVRKGISAEEGAAAAERILKHGIELNLYYLIGFPFETEETLQDTYAAIRRWRNRASVTLSTFTPYPRTELYEYCKKHHLVDETYNVALHNHQSLDCFCAAMNPAKFKGIAKEMQDFVDRSNRRYRLRRMFSWNTLWRLREYGLRASMSKLRKAFIAMK